MPWINYHSHTNFCDGKTNVEEFILAAIKENFSAYGISSHAPIGTPTEWTIDDNLLTKYLQQINRLKDKYEDSIEIYLGLEVDYIPSIAGRYSEILKHAELDYFIGSIHFVGAFENGNLWNIDYNKELFDKGIKEIYNNNGKAAVLDFYAITREMILHEKPDIIAHLDKIKMFNENNIYFDENTDWYRNELEQTLEAIKQTKSIVEINTRGYYNYNQSDLYPSNWILKRIKAYNIPVILSSDAHKPDEISKGFNFAAEILNKIGINTLWALIDNSWKEFEFNTNGLIL